MKLVIVAYNEALETDVMESLEAAGVENYTRLVGVQGRGTSSGPHLGTPIWPKLNHLLLLAVNDQAVAGVLDAVRSLRKSAGTEGVKAFVLSLDEVT